MAGADDSLSGPRMLIGDPERERFSALLRDHFAEGRLTLEELRRRAEIVLAATYQDEADQAFTGLPPAAPGPAVTAGLPVTTGPADARPTRRGLLARRGHAESDRPSPGWERTAERFRDPSSGLVMRVWIDPADGSRHYVPDEPSA